MKNLYAKILTLLTLMLMPFPVLAHDYHDGYENYDQNQNYNYYRGLVGDGLDWKGQPVTDTRTYDKSYDPAPAPRYTMDYETVNLQDINRDEFFRDYQNYRKQYPGDRVNLRDFSRMRIVLVKVIIMDEDGRPVIDTPVTLDHGNNGRIVSPNLRDNYIYSDNLGQATFAFAPITNNAITINIILVNNRDVQNQFQINPTDYGYYYDNGYDYSQMKRDYRDYRKQYRTDTNYRSDLDDRVNKRRWHYGLLYSARNNYRNDLYNYPEYYNQNRQTNNRDSWGSNWTWK